MLTTVAEFDSDKDLVKAYAELLAHERIMNGSTKNFDEILKDIKFETLQCLQGDETIFNVLLEDAKKCYDSIYSCVKEYLNQKDKTKIKDHYNYKIPLDLYNATKKDFEIGIVEMLVKEGNLFIRGESDTGKSHLVVATLREHVKNNPNMKIEMFYEDDFHEMGYEESQNEIKRLKQLDGVVFDDLGAIGLGPDKRNLIKGLIYSLIRNAKLILICTNCEIDKLYDSRTGSKIIGACTIVNKKPTGTRKQNKKEIEI